MVRGLAGADRPVPPLPTPDPVGVVKGAEAGVLQVHYRGNPARIELEPATFEAYLVEEGLDHIVQERAERGEAALPGTERYSRCSKAFIAVGSELGLPDQTTVL